MTLDPNKYKSVFPTIYRLWERDKDKEDFEKVISEIGTSTGVHLIAVCMALEQKYGDIRIEPVRKRLEEFYKIDEILPIEGDLSGMDEHDFIGRNPFELKYKCSGCFDKGSYEKYATEEELKAGLPVTFFVTCHCRK